MKEDPVAAIAHAVADSGAAYAGESWLSYAPPGTREAWMGRFYDAIYASVYAAIEQYEAAQRQPKEQRVGSLNLVCLKCRKPLRVPKCLGGEAVACPTCGHRQKAPAASDGGNGP